MNQERILNLVTTVVKWHLQHFGEEAADKTLSKIVEMGVVSRLSNSTPKQRKASFSELKPKLNRQPSFSTRLTIVKTPKAPIHTKNSPRKDI